MFLCRATLPILPLPSPRPSRPGSPFVIGSDSGPAPGECGLAAAGVRIAFVVPSASAACRTCGVADIPCLIHAVVQWILQADSNKFQGAPSKPQ